MDSVLDTVLPHMTTSSSHSLLWLVEEGPLHVVALSAHLETLLLANSRIPTHYAFDPNVAGSGGQSRRVAEEHIRGSGAYTARCRRSRRCFVRSALVLSVGEDWLQGTGSLCKVALQA